MKDKSAFAWLNKNTIEYRFSIGLLTVIEIIISLLGVLYALVMKQMVDEAVAKNRDGFILGVIGFALLVVSQLILRIITRQLSESVRSDIENTLKKKLFANLFYKEYESVNLIHSEEWMNRMTSDTSICASGMTDILAGFMGMLIRLVGSLGLIFYLQPILAMIIIPSGLVFLLITLFLRNPLKRYHKEVQQKDGKVRIYLQERISSMLVVRTFGMEEKTIDDSNFLMKEHKRARMKKAMISNICNSGFSLAINGMYLIGIAFCGYGIIIGKISFGTLTAMIQLIGQLQSPLSGLSGYVPRYYTMMASAERLMEVEDYPNVDTNQVLSGKEARWQYEKKLVEIVFDGVSFAYKKSQKILDRVSFSITKGDYIAITGTSGCGKSTMLKVLMGIYKPHGGEAKVLMKDGNVLLLSNMRHLFAYVPQGNFLMSGSIREVITFGKEEDNNDYLEKVIHLACADFIYSLPKQLDTMLGEKGAGLSEGQMQRIAIARALYSDCPILILDESTSALDWQTEQKLLNNLKRLTNKTVLIVTHRPKALEICNKQLVFKNGCVKEKINDESNV